MSKLICSSFELENCKSMLREQEGFGIADKEINLKLEAYFKQRYGINYHQIKSIHSECIKAEANEFIMKMEDIFEARGVNFLNLLSQAVAWISESKKLNKLFEVVPYDGELYLAPTELLFFCFRKCFNYAYKTYDNGFNIHAESCSVDSVNIYSRIIILLGNSELSCCEFKCFNDISHKDESSLLAVPVLKAFYKAVPIKNTEMINYESQKRALLKTVNFKMITGDPIATMWQL